MSELETFFDEFIDAFNRLDWERFTSFFCDDATVYSSLTKVVGVSSVESSFRVFFDKMRSERSGPQYLYIEPLEINVKDLGVGCAILSYHFFDLEGVCQYRSMFLVLTNGSWKIQHLHASHFIV